MSQLNKIYSHNIDLVNNAIYNAKLNPLSTVNRLGLILTINDDGYISWDIDLKKLFIWTGIFWKSSSADNYIDINKYIVREKPSGIINGINNIFLLNGNPILGKEMVFVNGLLMDEGFVVEGGASDLGTNISIPLALKLDGYYSQILLSNPGTTAANATITYTGNSGPYTVTLSVPAAGTASHSVYEAAGGIPEGFYRRRQGCLRPAARRSPLPLQDDVTGQLH